MWRKVIGRGYRFSPANLKSEDNVMNEVIWNYVDALAAMVSSLNTTLTKLGDNQDVNMGSIKTADIQLTAINSQIVILQSALDSYGSESS